MYIFGRERACRKRNESNDWIINYWRTPYVILVITYHLFNGNKCLWRWDVDTAWSSHVACCEWRLENLMRAYRGPMRHAHTRPLHLRVQGGVYFFSQRCLQLFVHISLFLSQSGSWEFLVVVAKEKTWVWSVSFRLKLSSWLLLISSMKFSGADHTTSLMSVLQRFRKFICMRVNGALPALSFSGTIISVSRPIPNPHPHPPLYSLYLTFNSIC